MTDEPEPTASEQATPWWARNLFRIQRPSVDRPDTLGSIQRFRVFFYALAAGILWGAATAWLAAEKGWAHPLLWGAGVFLFGLGFIYWGSDRLMRGSAGLMSHIYLPKDGGGPERPAYSDVEALAIRGRYDEALDRYRAIADARPADPEPRLRGARLLRDDADRPEEAIRWFREAREVEGAGPEAERLITEQIIEIYRRKLDRPTAALPELARYRERFPDGPAGEWARTEYRRLKEELRETADP